MANKVVIETIYGKRHKYEIVKTSPGAVASLISSSSFSIYRDGEYYKGSYSSLVDAVRAAKLEG